MFSMQMDGLNSMRIQSEELWRQWLKTTPKLGEKISSFFVM
jgi:hypothetical protein